VRPKKIQAYRQSDQVRSRGNGPCNNRVVLLVIFGAGASYDSVPHLPPPPPNSAGQSNFGVRPPSLPRPYDEDRPPLANQLFDDRETFVKAMEQFGDCRALVPLLRKSGVSVEKELARFQEEAVKYPRRHCQLAAVRYYLHTALWRCVDRWRTQWHHGITNYVTFLDQIERWRFERSEHVCLVTFNYDTMIEDAIRQVLHFPISDINGYISHKDYSLIKLHGSVNWGREVPGKAVPLNSNAFSPLRNPVNHQTLIDEVASLRITDQYHLVRQCPMLREEAGFLFPALSIPVENKDVFECPGTHVDRLERLLPKVTKIVTIGWRATEAEFLSMLHRRSPKQIDLMIVSGDAGGVEETNRNLSRPMLAAGGGPPARFDFRGIAIDSGFTGAILRELEKLDGFLRWQPRI
jgi:hypothetical protein